MQTLSVFLYDNFSQNVGILLPIVSSSLVSFMSGLVHIWQIMLFNNVFQRKSRPKKAKEMERVSVDGEDLSLNQLVIRGWVTSSQLQ